LSPGLDHRAQDQLAVCLRDPRCRHPDRARDLKDSILGKAGLAKRPQPLGGIEIIVAEYPLVRIGVGNPERNPRTLQKLKLHPGALGNLARGVLGPGAANQRALHRQQHQPARGGGLAQVLYRHAVGGQFLQQREPGLPRLTLEPLQHALRLEVDLRHRRIFHHR